MKYRIQIINKSAADWWISLKFGTAFDHNPLYHIHLSQGVKGQGHSMK